MASSHAEAEALRSNSRLLTDAYDSALRAPFGGAKPGRSVSLRSAVPLLPPDRLSKWCVFAALILLLLGFGIMRGAASIDGTVLGGMLMGLGCIVGFCAYKLDPKVVRRFFRD